MDIIMLFSVFLAVVAGSVGTVVFLNSRGKKKAPEVKDRFTAAAGDAAQAAKVKAGEAKDKMSEGGAGSSDGSLIGEVSTSDYTPHETKVQNA